MITKKEALDILSSTTFYEYGTVTDHFGNSYGTGISRLSSTTKEALKLAIKCLEESIKSEEVI